MAATSKQAWCDGFASSTNGCSQDPSTCAYVQAASASVDEWPPTDAEQPDEENNLEWGNSN
eukprot:7249560-Lingulodinium_polyedra.AAC.1